MEIKVFDDLGYGLSAIRTDKFKTTLVSLSFQAPIQREAVTKRSLLPYVLRNASQTYPTKKALNTYLESLYGASISGTVEKRGKTQNIKFYLSLANEKFLPGGEPLLEEGIALLKDILFNPLLVEGAFDPQVVEVEKRLMKEYLESLYDDKTSYALQQLMENMCAGEDFSIRSSGYVEDLPGIDGKDLYEAYLKMLASDSLTITIAGDIDPDQVHDLFKEHFAFRGPQRDYKQMIDRQEKEPKEVEVLTEAQDIAQGKLNIGYRTFTRIGDEDYLPLLVFNGMFGGYAHSKLFVNVREKASLCYYCASRLDNYKGLLYVYSGIEFKNYEKALEIIDQQLEDMKQGNFTDDELCLSQKSLINSKLESLDQASGMMAHESLNELLSPPLSVEGWIEKVNGVTREDIIRVSGKIKKDTIYFLTGKEADTDGM